MSRGAVKESFGAFIRREREAKEIGLREMSKMIGVSPTYLSKVERDEFAPPTEDKVRKVAEIIGCDGDELVKKAGRVPFELSEIIRQHPHRHQLTALLRTTKGLTADEISKLVRQGEKAKRK